ncbi:hypothetical protein AGMMS49944_23620 [Spirochaetia bacterium]|nr:hypothetical protein AGMMS49944_23620 [Spirochaetia bacterium]
MFVKKPYETALKELCGGVPPASRNLGGPSVVALAHAAQVLITEGARSIKLAAGNGRCKKRERLAFYREAYRKQQGVLAKKLAS